MGTRYSKLYWKYWRQACGERVARDFVRTFVPLLAGKFGMGGDAARCTAEAVCARMREPRLTYHNPLHVLSVLDWADVNGVRLAPWEKLVLLFHDVIYDPFAPPGQNERLSALVAEGMMAGVKKADVGLLREGILATAQHTAGEVDKRFHVILDLDVCAFAWDAKNFAAQSKAVAGEFIPVIGKARWTAGRDQFLRSLLAKGPVFRSAGFKRFEAAAQGNIRGGLLAEMGAVGG